MLRRIAWLLAFSQRGWPFDREPLPPARPRPDGRRARIQSLADPAAALAVHLCIGEIYGFSVFNVPLTRVVGITSSINGRDWTIPEVGWIYSIALIMLGLSAALLGRWVERVGPRKTMFASACCFCGGLLAVRAWASPLHNIWLLYLGYGVIGGHRPGPRLHRAGLDARQMVPRPAGHGDRPGDHGLRRRCLDRRPARRRADGPLQVDARRSGVKEAFLVMGGVYFAFMMFGAFARPRARTRVAARGIRAARDGRRSSSRTRTSSVDVAWKTPQFWLLWVVLCLNVTAGIGILGQASLMCQDMFGVPAAVGGGFAGLLSLFNMGGRFFWSSMSDLTGRKAIYCVYFLLGAVLYVLVPFTQKHAQRDALRPRHRR